MATPIRMKKKLMNKVHLDGSGQMVIAVVPAASDAASKGVSAQPANILTPQEVTGLSPEAAPVPPALGDPAPASVTVEAAKDPNAQKETTQPEQPNLGEGKVVAATEEVAVPKETI